MTVKRPSHAHVYGDGDVYGDEKLRLQGYEIPTYVAVEAT